MGGLEAATRVTKGNEGMIDTIVDCRGNGLGAVTHDRRRNEHHLNVP